MTTPKDRDALIELMARASTPGAWYWEKQVDPALRLNSSALAAKQRG